MLTCLLCVRVLLCCCIHIVFNVLLTSLTACLHGESSLDAMPGVFPVQVRDGQLATAEGVSYLEAKYLLLLHYCIHLVFYVLLKAEGRSARDHPVIARLVEIRAFLERARPIDKRLRYQMDRLLAAAALVQVSQPGCGAAAHRSKVIPMTSLVQGRIVSTLHASHVFKAWQAHAPSCEPRCCHSINCLTPPCQDQLIKPPGTGALATYNHSWEAAAAKPNNRTCHALQPSALLAAVLFCLSHEHVSHAILGALLLLSQACV